MDKSKRKLLYTVPKLVLLNFSTIGLITKNHGGGPCNRPNPPWWCNS